MRPLDPMLATAAAVLGLSNVAVTWAELPPNIAAEWRCAEGNHWIGVSSRYRRAPRYVLQYLIFHEALHAKLPPRKYVASSAVRLHHYAFRVAERLIPNYARAVAWLERHQ